MELADRFAGGHTKGNDMNQTATTPRPLTIDTEPPTAHLSGFAHYPVRFCLTDASGYHRLHGADTVEDLVDSAYRRMGGERIIAEHIAPDGVRVVTEPWAGGTWSSMCGSTCWVLDPDDVVKHIEGVLAALGGALPQAQTGRAEHQVSLTQSLWITGRRTREEHGWDGFRVECEQSMRHDGPCSAMTWRWDARARTPLAGQA